MQYQSLYRLQIQHHYYTNLLCPDFDFTPTASCQRLLRRHRMVFKKSLSGFEVYNVHNNVNEGDFVVEQGTTFRFWLLLKNPDFLNFTETTHEVKTTFPIFYNEDGKEQLGMRSESLTDLKKTFQQMTGTSSFSIPINAFGWVEIVVGDKWQNGMQFLLSFQAKLCQWKYYLVSQANNAASFTIQDEDIQRVDSPILFNETVEVSEDKQDRMSVKLMNQFPTAKHLLVTSKERIACSQTGKKNLQLKKDGKIIIDHLPNPPLRSGGIQIIQHI